IPGSDIEAASEKTHGPAGADDAGADYRYLVLIHLPLVLPHCGRQRAAILTTWTYGKQFDVREARLRITHSRLLIGLRMWRSPAGKSSGSASLGSAGGPTTANSDTSGPGSLPPWGTTPIRVPVGKSLQLSYARAVPAASRPGSGWRSLPHCDG